LRDASCVKALIGPGELAIVAIVLGSRGVQETESSGFGGGLGSSIALVLSPTRRRYIRSFVQKTIFRSYKAMKMDRRRHVV